MKKIAVIDGRAREDIECSLKGIGFEVIRTLPCPLLDEPVAYHPDMLMFKLENTVFCHREYIKKAEKIFSRLSERGYEIRALECRYGKKYPFDVTFNRAVIGSTLLSGKKTAECEIDTLAKKLGYISLKVNQGYTKCSTLTISENAVITADSSIAKAIESCGKEALTVSEGHITLDGYSHGFIGGASGMCCDTVYFAGDIATHPDGEKIVKFCHSHGKSTFSLCEGILNDIGTIMFF